MSSARPIRLVNPRPQCAERTRIIQPVNSGKHQPLQGKQGSRGEQPRQRPMRYFAQQIAARAGEIDAAELQNVVASDVVEVARAECIVLLVPMLRRSFE